MLIAKRPNYTKFLLLNLVNKNPIKGEPKITATEYILNIYPNQLISIPYCFNSIGKNGAIKA